MLNTGGRRAGTPIATSSRGDPEWGRPGELGSPSIPKNSRSCGQYSTSNVCRCNPMHCRSTPAPTAPTAPTVPARSVQKIRLCIPYVPLLVTGKVLPPEARPEFEVNNLPAWMRTRMNAEDMRAMIKQYAPLPTPIRPVTELPVGEPLRYTPPVAPMVRVEQRYRGAMLPTRPLEPPPRAPVTPPPAPPTMPPVRTGRASKASPIKRGP